MRTFLRSLPSYPLQESARALPGPAAFRDVDVAWLLIARRWLNRPSFFWAWLDRRAYAAFLLHPLVLVGLSLLLRGWEASALLKWLVVGWLSIVGTWIVADPLVRPPGLRRIV